MTFCPTGRVGRYFLRTPLPHQSYTAFEPDVLLSDGHSSTSQSSVLRRPSGTRPDIQKGRSRLCGTARGMVGDLVASGIPHWRRDEDQSCHQTSFRGRSSICS